MTAGRPLSAGPFGVTSESRPRATSRTPSSGGTSGILICRRTNGLRSSGRVHCEPMRPRPSSNSIAPRSYRPPDDRFPSNIRTTKPVVARHPCPGDPPSYDWSYPLAVSRSDQEDIEPFSRRVARTPRIVGAGTLQSDETSCPMGLAVFTPLEGEADLSSGLGGSGDHPPPPRIAPEATGLARGNAHVVKEAAGPAPVDSVIGWSSGSATDGPIGSGLYGLRLSGPSHPRPRSQARRAIAWSAMGPSRCTGTGGLTRMAVSASTAAGFAPVPGRDDAPPSPREFVDESIQCGSSCVDSSTRSVMWSRRRWAPLGILARASSDARR